MSTNTAKNGIRDEEVASLENQLVDVKMLLAESKAANDHLIMEVFRLGEDNKELKTVNELFRGEMSNNASVTATTNNTNRANRREDNRENRTKGNIQFLIPTKNPCKRAKRFDPRLQLSTSCRPTSSAPSAPASTRPYDNRPPSCASGIALLSGEEWPTSNHSISSMVSRSFSGARLSRGSSARLPRNLSTGSSVPRNSSSLTRLMGEMRAPATRPSGANAVWGEILGHPSTSNPPPGFRAAGGSGGGNVSNFLRRLTEEVSRSNEARDP